jgi:transposase
VDRQYVGIDFHRRRSVIVRLNSAGERLGVARVGNDPFEFASEIGAAGDAPAVVIEATYGWYWVVDLLQDLGATVHLANPKALNWGDRRVKNDVVDATDLADMLRMGRLAHAWIAPPAIRELRERARTVRRCRKGSLQAGPGELVSREETESASVALPL